MNGNFFDSQNSKLVAETFPVVLTSGVASSLPTLTGAPARMPVGVVIAEAVYGEKQVTALAWAWTAATGALTVTATLSGGGFISASVVVLYQA
jgi:hypothetical protein